MAHWFHRNPMKTTAVVNFDLGTVLSASETSKIASDLRLTRKRLLELFLDASNELEEVETEFTKYTTLMNGFLFGMDEKGGDSKLKNIIMFKWTDSMLGLMPTELADTWFEFLSFITCMAIWYMKHAARVAAKDDVNEAQAKEVHKCLRKAGGIFDYVQKEKGRINENVDPGADLSASVLAAYTNECTAEAQEVTVARAIELKHSPSLISALSMETARLFEKAASSISAESPAIFDKWVSYLRLKHNLYTAYAYAYHGEALLGEDKCGDAVKCCQEGLKYYGFAVDLCTTYSKARGPGATIQPDTHQFFLRIKPILLRHMEKAERENGFIYHQKVPDVVPELATADVFGLAKPDPFIYPQGDGPWSQQVYGQFDITKQSMPEFAKAKRSSKALPEPKEQAIYQSEKKHKGESGCVIS